MSSSRLQKVADVLRQAIAEVLLAKANDQRIGFVSITKIKVAADMSYALVYFSCMGTDLEKKRSMRGLRSASKFIQSAVAEKVNFKFMPQLKFVRDQSLEEGARVLDLLGKLQSEREATGQDEENIQSTEE